MAETTNDRDEKVVDQLVENIYRKYRLPKNQAKGGWLHLTTPQLIKLLHDEIYELLKSVETFEDGNTFAEAADIAIFAAFLADPSRIKNELARRVFQ